MIWRKKEKKRWSRKILHSDTGSRFLFLRLNSVSCLIVLHLKFVSIVLSATTTPCAQPNSTESNRKNLAGFCLFVSLCFALKRSHYMRIHDYMWFDRCVYKSVRRDSNNKTSQPFSKYIEISFHIILFMIAIQSTFMIAIL